MEFMIKTVYDYQAMKIMARALRKTVRKRRSRRSHILGWIVVILGLLISLPLGNSNFTVSSKTVITWLAIAAILAALLWEDAINGYFAVKRMLPQLKTSTAIFTEEGYHSETEVGNSDFRYDNIIALAETKEFFVFIFSNSHGQIYDKHGFISGSEEDFRSFVEKATGLEVQKL